MGSLGFLNFREWLLGLVCSEGPVRCTCLTGFNEFGRCNGFSMFGGLSGLNGSAALAGSISFEGCIGSVVWWVSEFDRFDSSNRLK